MKSRQLKVVSRKRGALPIYGDVCGAPFRVGQRVQVASSKDETFNTSYRRRIGTVEYFEYHCGCGQSYPCDPMIGVRFRNGKTEEFWAEELHSRDQ